jgi:EAL domain-containing protein (putative c-di-GMP-specific phosphodiesterase class I)
MAIELSAIAEMIDRGFHATAFQPIVGLDSHQIIGFEALMRGPAATAVASPAAIFREAAADSDLLYRLDLACLLSAVRVGRVLPENVLLFVNMRGETLIHLSRMRHEVEVLFEQLQMSPRRLVLEISELTEGSHVRVIARALKVARNAGMRLALDDVGARHAWLQHMLLFEPDILKLDRFFIKGIDRSRRKQNLVASFARFCSETGSNLIAEGIETNEELMALLEAGVRLGQGYLLGRPQAIQNWMPANEAMGERARVGALMPIGGTTV